jgi:hypothetical protein
MQIWENWYSYKKQEVPKWENPEDQFDGVRWDKTVREASSIFCIHQICTSQIWLAEYCYLSHASLRVHRYFHTLRLQKLLSRWGSWNYKLLRTAYYSYHMQEKWQILGFKRRDRNQVGVYEILNFMSTVMYLELLWLRTVCVWYSTMTTR